MNKLLMTLALGSAVFAGTVSYNTSSSIVSYNTSGSTLSCNGVAGCVQNTVTSITLGGLTLTYNAGSGLVPTPSFISLGNIVSSGTGTNVNMTGILLTINVTSTPPGANGALPNGSIAGSLSTSTSSTSITFSPSNTTTLAGTLPGVTITGATDSFTYQVSKTTFAIQAPSVGNPLGQTSIQGFVDGSGINTSAPEPTTIVLMGAGLGLVGMLRRRAAR